MILVISTLFISSCDIINPEEDIPAYIYISEFDLSTDPYEQGSGAHKITDVWVNVDGSLIGAFEMPVIIPVLAEGNRSLTLRAGIKKNGIAASRCIYPFFTFYNIDTTLTQEKVDTLYPVVEYFNNTVFKWMEAFEDPGITFMQKSNSDTSIIISQDNVFEGLSSGAVFLDDNNTFFICETVDSFLLPKQNSPVYLEMNYMNNNIFQIGLYGYTPAVVDIQVIAINYSENWNKIYIDITDAVNSVINADYFKIYIIAEKNDTVPVAEIYFDNFKLIHLE